MPIWVPGDGGGPTPTPSSSRYTTSELVEETLGELSGHTLNMGQVTWLTESISDTALTFKVNDPEVVSRGIVEIGNELVYVATSEDATCTVMPTGRGYRASTAQAWAQNTEVTYGPRFPRHAVLDRINDIIRNVYPMLWGVGTYEFLYEPVVQAFELPAEVEGVLAVEWDEVGPQDSWFPISTYRFSTDAATSDFPTGKSIWLPELTPGRTVRVRYRKRPSTISLDGSLVDSGLSETAWDAIKYGALHRLASSLTLGQLDTDSASSAEYGRTGKLVAVEIAERFYALHVQFLEEERARQLDAHPIRVNYTR